MRRTVLHVGRVVFCPGLDQSAFGSAALQRAGRARCCDQRGCQALAQSSISVLRVYLEAFANLPDSRVVGRSKHDLMEMLVVAV